ncbi:MAG: ATPase, partial [Planctomycetes bacterium]|nr:ATPase [Planctomycetota bacterium]
MNSQKPCVQKGDRPAPRLEYLGVKNYRALRDLELRPLPPLTVLLGPNGSGKSTVFDVFAFLSECFTVGLRKAWDRRGRFKDLRSRNSQGPIVFELKYREPGFPLITYHLEVNEDRKGPYVAKEWLRWTRRIGKAGRPFNFLSFEDGSGFALLGEKPSESDERVEETLASREYLAISTLG